MILKILRTIFLAVGLVMVCLGFFNIYELAKPSEEAIDASPSPASRQLETYTLSNNAYSEKAVEELEFRNVGNDESTLIYRLDDLPESDERINTAGFAEEFDAFEEAAVASKPEAGNFPVLLICGGSAMLALGIFSFRLEQ